MKNNYKAIELFAGIGGFGIACENLGIKTVWKCSTTPNCRICSFKNNKR